MESFPDEQQMKFLQKTYTEVVCKLGLTEKTPEYTLFTKVRAALGMNVSNRFLIRSRSSVRKRMRLGTVRIRRFHALISRVTVWEEKDKRTGQGIEELNNVTLPEVSHDEDAKIAARAKTSFCTATRRTTPWTWKAVL